MLVLIYEGQIAGMASPGTSPNNLPLGFTMAEAPPGKSLNDLYWDGTQLQVKPDRPSELSYWDFQNNVWITPLPPRPQPNWALLVEKLKQTEVGFKCYAAAKAKNRASVPLFAVVIVLLVTQSITELNYALADLIRENPTLFTPSDFAAIRQALEESFFDPSELPILNTPTP